MQKHNRHPFSKHKEPRTLEFAYFSYSEHHPNKKSMISSSYIWRIVSSREEIDFLCIFCSEDFELGEVYVFAID